MDNKFQGNKKSGYLPGRYLVRQRLRQFGRHSHDSSVQHSRFDQFDLPRYGLPRGGGIFF